MIEEESHTIDWHEGFDNDGNSFWYGASPYCSDSGSAPDIYWRLRQRLVDNRIEWYADHDTELNGEGESWPTLEEAKKACQLAHNTVILEFLNSVD